MNKFSQFTAKGKCVDISYEGYGVFKNNEITAFVTGMYPGDEGEVEIEYKRNGCFFGHIKKLDVFSEDRIDPLCKICTACGGCQFQPYKYEKELEFKTNLVKEQFKKIAHIDVDVNPTIGMENNLHYRNKIQMPIGWNMYKNKAIYGFYRQGTHRIIENTDCNIEDSRAKNILDTIVGTMNELSIPPYDEKDGSGIIRHALIRTSRRYKQVMLVVVTTRFNFPAKKAFFDKIRENCTDITTIVLNINDKKTNVVLGEKEEIIFGSGKIKDTLCGLEFEISSRSFFQTNPVMTEVLYNKAMEVASIENDDVVMDAYSGIGTIGLIAAKKAKRVIAVENVEEAVKDAKKNAAKNNVTNYECFQEDATSFIKKYQGNVDVLFMDPPRKGSTLEFLEVSMKLMPKKIVYVSCNPSTLARDVSVLLRKYALCSVSPIDMFPRTNHVETVALLQLKA